MRKEIEHWWMQAKRDLVTASNCLNSNDYYACAFFAQQAVEKGLKAVYLESHQLWKIHDLVKLAREIKAPSEIILKCSQINPVYTDVRYPEADELPSEKVTKKDGEEILKLAREVLLWIEKRLL